MNLFLPINLAVLQSHSIHILNQHDPGGALVHNLFTITVRREVL